MRIASLTLLLLLLAACSSGPIERHLQQTLEVPASPPRDGETLPILVYLPQGYDDPARAEERWPVVVFLHGIGAEGKDPRSVARSSLPNLLEEGMEVPFVVASPQLPSFAKKWRVRHVVAAIEHVARRYRIDRDRVHLTGVSAGASTGWDVVKQRPDLFASFVPLSSWASARGVQNMAHVPVWAFQGRIDPIAPPFVVQSALCAHRACGGSTRLTLLTRRVHWLSPHVYGRPDLWAWWASQSVGGRPPPGPP